MAIALVLICLQLSVSYAEDAPPPSNNNSPALVRLLRDHIHEWETYATRTGATASDHTENFSIKGNSGSIYIVAPEDGALEEEDFHRDSSESVSSNQVRSLGATITAPVYGENYGMSDEYPFDTRNALIIQPGTNVAFTDIIFSSNCMYSLYLPLLDLCASS